MHARKYKDLELELAAFRELDNPDLYYQYHSHSYPGKKGAFYSVLLSMQYTTVYYSAYSDLHRESSALQSSSAACTAARLHRQPPAGPGQTLQAAVGV